jgi:hypothetical protein
VATTPERPHTKKHPIPILNPGTGCARYTSLRNALLYIARGLARWRGGGIEFIASDVRCMHVARETEYDMAAHTGLASFRAIQGLPVSGRPETVIQTRTRRPAAVVR